MFEPIRGGTRGGQAEFKWSDVSADKDRENYLGHSINAPTGRWQKNKDVHWYNRDLPQTETEKQAEIRKIKEAEEDALAVALGFAPVVRNNSSTTAAPTPSSAGPSASPTNDRQENDAGQLDKAERKQRKEEKRARKEEKRARKAEKRRRRADGDSDTDGSDRPRPPYRQNDSRSNSPVRRASTHRQEYRRSRSRSPIRKYSREPRESSRDASLGRSDARYSARRRSRTPPYYRHSQVTNGHDDRSLERDRERDRRRWDDNTRRDTAYDRRPRRE